MGISRVFAFCGIFLFLAGSFSVSSHAAESDRSTEIAEASISANAFANLEGGVFRCPAPNLVKCRTYAESVGPWTQNGGFRPSVNTDFAPNNQCANVIPINGGTQSRLVCCYKECGVLLQDVKFRDCKKETVSDFRCQ